MDGMKELNLEPPELAARWRLSVLTLRDWRVDGNGPRYIKFGRKVLYPISEIEAFEKKHLRSAVSVAVDKAPV